MEFRREVLHTLVTADRRSAVSRKDVVRVVQYANISHVDRDIPAALRFRSSRRLNPVLRSDANKHDAIRSSLAPASINRNALLKSSSPTQSMSAATKDFSN